MKTLSHWSSVLLAGIVVIGTVGGKAANAQTAHTFLVPFVGVVHDTCQMQSQVQETGLRTVSQNQSICETQQVTLSLTETTPSVRDDAGTATFHQESPSAALGYDTLIQITTVIK